MEAKTEESDRVIPTKVTDESWVYALGVQQDGSKSASRSGPAPAGHCRDHRTPGVANFAGAEEPSRTDGDGHEEEKKKKAGASSVDTVLDGLEETSVGEQPETFVGKWMLFFDQVEEDDAGLTQHDRAWLKVAPLCLDGRLCQAKASTAKKDPMAHTQELGCICCYTRDYRDHEEVRKKADLVRSALEEELREKVIYYKTDSASRAKQYRVLGCGRVSLYRHKPDYSFWKTSEDNTSWVILYGTRRLNGPRQWNRSNTSR